MSGPLASVLGAFDAGAVSLDDVARRTGLDRARVRIAVDHLVRLGRLEATPLTTGCPSGGCGGCPAAAGCASAGEAPPRGGLLVLRRTPPAR